MQDERCLICREFGLDTDITGERIGRSPQWLLRAPAGVRLPGIIDIFPREHVPTRTELSAARLATLEQAEAQLEEFWRRTWTTAIEEIGQFPFRVNNFTFQEIEHEHVCVRMQPTFFDGAGLNRLEDRLAAPHAQLILRYRDLIRPAFLHVAQGTFPGEMNQIFEETAE
jgi:hypothetical protein